MQINKIYLLPMLIVLLTMTFGGILAPGEGNGGDIGFASDTRRLILLGIAYIIAIWCFFKSFKFSVFLLKKNALFFIFILFAFSSMFWSRFPTKVAINFVHYTGFLLAILSAIYYYQDKTEKVFYFIALIMGFSLLTSIIFSLAFPQIGIHAITGRWQGVSGNPNTLGIFCIVSVWANTADFFCNPARKSKFLKLILYAITITALIGARSTTSFVVSFFALTGTWYLISLENKPISTWIFRNIIFGFFGIILILSLFIVKPEILTIDGSLSLIGKDSTLTGRTNLWEFAHQAIEIKPFLGWSFDSNRSVLAKFSMQYGQFHNGYLDLIVRGGYVSLIFLISLVFQAAYRMKKLSKINYHHAVVWFTLLLCILVHNITEASIMRETHILWFLFVLIIHTISYDITNKETPSNKRLLHNKTLKQHTVTKNYKMSY